MLYAPNGSDTGTVFRRKFLFFLITLKYYEEGFEYQEAIVLRRTR